MSDVDLDTLDDEAFAALPLVIRGESKEVRYAGRGSVVIRYLPTIYSFTHNRSGVVPGSELLRLRAMRQLLEVLRAAGLRHAYRTVTDKWVLSDLVMPAEVEFAKYGVPAFDPPDLTREEKLALAKAPPIEVVVKRYHGGTSKHRYRGMDGSTVRTSHPLYPHMPIRVSDAYPTVVVRFDWRNPLRDANGDRVADEILPTCMADWYLDAARAERTARRAFSALEQHLGDRDIVIYDLCLFIAEDGETLYGEVTQDCGRFRHFELGHLDKDVWRAGGSSEQVLAKWALLSEMLERPIVQSAKAPIPLSWSPTMTGWTFSIGTTNPYKIRELADILSPSGCKLVTAELPEVEETESTFAGNARLKASAHARVFGGVTIAEDSGLEVPALGGLPGPWSARFADCELTDRTVTSHRQSGDPRGVIDPKNVARVLELMRGIEQPYRAASFVVALAVAAPDGTVLFEAESKVHGWLTEAPRGAGGFGYDSIFVGGDTGGATYAELDPARKNLRSHRRRVLRDFTAWLARVLRVQETVDLVVDGNDGTGKSTLVAKLRDLGFRVKDRGAPTKMTDDPIHPITPGELYVILDAPVEVSEARLLQAGKSLEERYHTRADLTHYRARFLEVARAIPGSLLVDASGTPEATFSRALSAIVHGAEVPSRAAHH
ncbi:MAG: non-canonical purine NTP pyrophosphatase [Polyangiaceae bacterium]